MALSFLLVSSVGLPAFAEVRTETCAHDSTGLEQTPALRDIKAYFGHGFVGFVNETEGSYVIVDLMKTPMTLTFYTSGLFDLVPIKSEGPLEICDDGLSLRMRGLDRDEEMKVVDAKLVMGSGGPKKTFMKGAMPPKLAKLHHYTERSIASEVPAHR